MIYVFLDTNFFLHHNSPVSVDWNKLLGAGDITLIVTMAVVRELDVKHHDGKTSGIRKRALDALKLAKSAGTERHKLKSGLFLTCLLQEPKTFDRYQLDGSLSDDRILCSALEFALSNSSERVVLLTNDTALSIKAPAHQLEVAEIPKAWRCRPAPDEKQAKLDELKDALSALPSLKFTFLNGQLFDEIEMPSPPRRTTRTDASISKVKTEIPIIAAYANPFSAMAPAIIGSYNRELVDYYETCSAWLQHALEFSQLQSRTARLDFLVTSDGKAPTTDVTIDLSFPAGLELLKSIEQLPSVPEPPDPPQLTSVFGLPVQDAEDPVASPLLTEIFGLLSQGWDDHQPSKWILKDKKVRFTIDKILHGDAVQLSMFVRFEDYSDIKGFKIASNIKCFQRDSIQADLNVKLIQKPSNAASDFL